MKYNINITNKGVSLDCPTAQQARKIDLYISLFCFLMAIGALIYINSIGIDNIESGAPFIFLVGGAILTIIFLVRALTKGRYLKQFPGRVYFNNERAVVEIYHESSIVKMIEIPYLQIQWIAPRLYLHRPRSGTNRRTSSWYSAAIYLKDGSVWDLTENSFSHIDFAKDWINKWADQVTLNANKPVDVVLPKAETEKLSIIHRGEELQVKWSNNFSDHTARKLLLPLLACIILSYVGFVMISTEGLELDTVISNLKSLPTANELPEVIIGLMFVIPLWTIFALWLLIALGKSIYYRLKTNKLIVNKNHISNTDFELSAHEVGTVNLNYSLNSKHRTIQFMRQVAEQYKQTVTSSNVEIIDLTDANGANQQIFKETDLSATDFFKGFIKTIPQQMKHAKKEAQAAEHNHLFAISFDRFSPLDVYVVKESILNKING